jgi:protein TonB
VTVIAAPRLGSGVALSVLLHGGLFAALFLFRPGPDAASPPVYRVQLIAAPAGERAIGVVQEAPAVVPPVEAPAPLAAVAKPTVARPAVVAKSKAASKPASKPVPKAATPTPAAVSPPANSTAAPPTAGGGPTGGKGADVANVDTPGIEFPYPGYTQNITRQLILRFGTFSGNFTGSVRFVIRRDGSVDPGSIQMVTRSGNYSFDQRAVGAVEAAANAKAFGALPPGFREDILPVTFRFSPALNR